MALDLASIVEPVCRANGVELVQTQWIRQRGASILRITIERPGDTEAEGPSGVTLADCQNVSRALSVALDVEEDAIPGRYQLEVSSPGLERPLVQARDFQRFSEREAKIKTSVPVDGRRSFTGILRGLRRSSASADASPEAVEIEADGQMFVIPLAQIAKAHLVVRFDDFAMGKKG